MERVQELINKLWKQHQQQEGPERLLATVQQLQESLTLMVRSEAAQSGGKVAVVLPPKRRPATVEVAAPKTVPVQTEASSSPAAIAPAVIPEQKQHAEPIASSAEKAVEPATAEPLMQAPLEPAAAQEPEQSRQPYTLQKPPATERVPPVTPAAPEPPKAAGSEGREILHLHIDTSNEAPTLLQQYTQPPKELHEVISGNKESLNDRLKQDKPELGHKLKETPIKDLRKAIGLNDKFLFIKELFRGDEAMYERSIKTINNFHILPEAEYWINRELTVKLGWDDSRDVVQAFYHLVKRRFS